ncbi:MAG: hypothetical protein ACYCO3_10890 [Mycobacteriales bacterium]
MSEPTSPEGTRSAAAYLGAAEGELRSARTSRRLVGMVDQRRLFPHRGTFELHGDSLVLGGWRTITAAQVSGVELTFTAAYPRWLAAGIRGGRSPSFGIFGSLGKPLVVQIIGEEPI